MRRLLHLSERSSSVSSKMGSGRATDLREVTDTLQFVLLPFSPVLLYNAVTARLRLDLVIFLCFVPLVMLEMGGGVNQRYDCIKHPEVHLAPIKEQKKMSSRCRTAKLLLLKAADFGAFKVSRTFCSDVHLCGAQNSFALFESDRPFKELNGLLGL